MTACSVFSLWLLNRLDGDPICWFSADENGLCAVHADELDDRLQAVAGDVVRLAREAQAVLRHPARHDAHRECCACNADHACSLIGFRSFKSRAFLMSVSL